MRKDKLPYSEWEIIKFEKMIVGVRMIVVKARMKAKERKSSHEPTGYLPGLVFGN